KDHGQVMLDHLESSLRNDTRYRTGPPPEFAPGGSHRAPSRGRPTLRAAKSPHRNTAAAWTHRASHAVAGSHRRLRSGCTTRANPPLSLTRIAGGSEITPATASEECRRRRLRVQSIEGKRMTDTDSQRDADPRPARRWDVWREALKGGGAAIVTFVIGTVVMLLLSAVLLLALLLRHPVVQNYR